jgi:hypothetical protein
VDPKALDHPKTQKEQARRKKKALMTPAIFMDRTELGTASS